MTIDELIRNVRRQLNAETIRYNDLTEQLNAVRASDTVDTARETALVRERAHVQALVQTLTGRIDDMEREAEADRAVAELQGRSMPTGTSTGRGTMYQGTGTRTDRGYLSLRGMADALRGSTEFNVRAFIAAGSVAAPPTVLEASPVSMGKPATSLLDVLPVRVVDNGSYGYLRQTVRTNAAAPVAVGDAKPQSTYTLTRVDGTLQVVAHLSEPINEKWLQDVASLEQFVEAELALGVNLALEDQILNGTGVAPQLDGLIATGTGTQAFATSPIVTVRTGLAQFEAAGTAAAAVVLASADWLAIETATLTAGGYVLGQGTNGAPLDRIKRTLWGTPVILSSAHTPGTAVLISEGAAGLVVDGAVDFKLGTIDDDFKRNVLRARSEIRAQVEVYRPHGIIVADLTA